MDLTKTVFLDRDGTMNEEVHYLHRPEDLKLLPGVGKAVRLLNQAGFRVAVVTNQAGVARGYYREEDVRNLHLHMNRLLAREGAHVDAFYFCPHHPEHGIGKYKTACRCRKPDIGMFEAADRDCPADRARSYMVGDKLIDTQAGHRFGVKSILVGTGYGAEIRAREEAEGTAVEGGGDREGNYDWYAPDLLRAAERILELDEQARGEADPAEEAQDKQARGETDPAEEAQDKQAWGEAAPGEKVQAEKLRAAAFGGQG